jgi:hypothetical protein
MGPRAVLESLLLWTHAPWRSGCGDTESRRIDNPAALVRPDGVGRDATGPRGSGDRVQRTDGRAERFLVGIADPNQPVPRSPYRGRRWVRFRVPGRNGNVRLPHLESAGLDTRVVSGDRHLYPACRGTARVDGLYHRHEQDPTFLSRSGSGPVAHTSCSLSTTTNRLSTAASEPGCAGTARGFDSCT